MRKVLLYSGGMDSWLIDKLWKPDVKLFFHTGTANNEQEYQRVKNLKDVEIIEMPLAQFEQIDNNYYLPLRNLHFAVYAAHYGDIICLGATGSSTHKDKNETFACLSENVINYLLSEDSTRPNSNISIVMPYKNTSKTELLAKYLELDGSDIQRCYDETFSCYNPINNSPCMKCTSCQSKFIAFYNNGYIFSDDDIVRFTQGVLDNPYAKPDAKELAYRLVYKNNTICIDFDNTITTLSGYPITGELRDGCKDELLLLKRKGYRLVLYTSRVGSDFKEAVEFCKQHELPFDDYVSNKPLAKYYIDDKAIKFNEWKDIHKEV